MNKIILEKDKFWLNFGWFHEPDFFKEKLYLLLKIMLKKANFVKFWLVLNRTKKLKAFFCGADYGVRTHDLGINSPTLHQLS